MAKQQKKPAAKKASRAVSKNAATKKPLTPKKAAPKKATKKAAPAKSAKKTPAPPLAPAGVPDKPKYIDRDAAEEVTTTYRAYCNSENTWISEGWVSEGQANSDAQPHIDANHIVDIKQKTS